MAGKDNLEGFSKKSEDEQEQKGFRSALDFKGFKWTFECFSNNRRKTWQVLGFWLALEISIIALILFEVIV